MKRLATDVLSGRHGVAGQAAFPLGTRTRPAIQSNFLRKRNNVKSAFVPAVRTYSSPAMATAAKEQTTKKKDDSNIFLDNLGKIFLAAIAGIIGMVVRSSTSTKYRNNVRDQIEVLSELDPVEIDELRIANSELTPEVFRTIMRDLVDRYPQDTCSYREFTRTTRTTMANLKGEAFTVQLGHLLDRVVADVLDKYEKSADDGLPLSLWLATLSLALCSSVDERIQVLYEVLENSTTPVTFSQVEDMVKFLQDTCQLPPDTQVVPTETKYPVQQWERGTPAQLVPWDGSKEDQIDLEAFYSILRSKSVCAWGECYHKKKL